MAVIVENYGLHKDGAVTWLLQGRKGNNFVGLKAQCPFQVAGGMCNHMIAPAAPVPDRIHWASWMKLFPDPLVQAMLPVPHEPGKNVLYVSDPQNDLGLYLAALSRLSSPIRQIVKPIWTFKVKQLEQELSSSNVQPLVLVQSTVKTQELIDVVGKLSLYAPRTVVVVGQPDVAVRPPIQRIETQIQKFALEDLMTLPLENLGSVLIRRHARGEGLDDPWEDRETRRTRQIQERS